MDETTAQLRSQLADQRREVGYDLEAIGDRLSPGRMADRGRARARRRIGSVRDSVMGSAESARGSIGDTAGSLAEGAREAPHQAAQRVQGNPLAAGAIAFGIGALVGSMVPTTRREEELARQVQPDLERVAHKAAEEARSMASQAADDLKPAVQEQAEQLSQQAGEAASHVKDEVRTGAGTTPAGG